VTSEPAPAELSDRLLALVGKPGGPLEDASLWAMEVVRAADLTPTMRRIELTSPGLDLLRYRPGQDLMFRIAVEGGAVTNRRYTIRTFDRDRATVTCDMLLHGNGPGARWAAAARPGDRIDAIGPRGKIWVESADWHWFLGDESAVPATLAMLEDLPPTATALALLDVATPGEEQAFVRRPTATVEVMWLHRDGAAPGGSLAAALVDRPLPPGTGRAYLAGEAHEMRALREQLLGLGFDAGYIAAKSYWTRGRANAEHGEPRRDES
jgi:NADPH-dependent ferric siderophore reductase